MNPSNEPLRVVTIVFFLVVIGLGSFLIVRKWHQNQMDQQQKQTQNECLQVVQKMEAKLDDMRKELENQQQTRPGDANFTTVFGTPASDQWTDSLPSDCTKDESHTGSFFTYLDQQPYMAELGLDGDSLAFFKECLDRLMIEPPVNVAEMKDLHRLVKNVTHLYRVLGKKRLMTAKTIIMTESRVIEPAMGVLYDLLVACGNPLPGETKSLDIERLYDYAGYFLNTLGGRSYLLRRDSKIRLLMNYYAILIVDKANDEKFNKYGIDVRPYIDYLFYDISNQKGLEYRERYLTRLAALRDKYL